MKAQILKLAGVETEAEFYKKFPTEEAFMKKHGKALKKAQTGAFIPGVGFGSDVKGIGKIINKSNTQNILGYAATAVPTIASGVSEIMNDTESLKKSRRSNKLAKLISTIPEEKQEREYVRPEDYLVEDSTKYGVAQNGKMISGNPTEIQNVYNPGDLYSGLEYEPLNDRNPKQYQTGGAINYGSLANSFGNFAGGLGNSAAGGGFQQGNISRTAGAIAGLAGTALGGPIGGLAAQTAVSLLASPFDAAREQEQKELDEERNSLLTSSNFGNSRKQQFGAYTKNGGSIPEYENGGWMNPEYNPQMIAKFGDYDLDQLLIPPYDAEMLRAGGHLKEYTPPSERAMYTGRDLPYQMEDGGKMAMGGDLQVHRGEAETMSYNPFLPDGGETVMFRGPSHDNGGMPISYGNNGVEVEGGEPAIKLQDGGSPDGNLVVYGNMIIPKYGVEELGDPKAKGKKFKHYIADLSKLEAKQNKLVEKTTQLINNADANDQFDKLTLNTGQANLIGTTMKLKDIAEKKKTAAAVQNAILDTASEMGLESDALAKGKIKYAKANDPYAEFGAKLEQFKPGGKKGKNASVVAPQVNMRSLSDLAKLYQAAVSTKDSTAIGKFQRAALNTLGADEIKKLTGVKNITSKSFVDGKFGPMTNTLGKAVTQKIQKIALPQGVPGENETYQAPPGEEVQEQGVIVPEWMPADVKNFIPGMSDEEMAAFRERNKVQKPEEDDSLNQVARLANSLMRYTVPSNQVPLDPTQLMGEMYALSNNRLEPVYAQTYQPNLTQPTSVNYQDQLNEITAQSRAFERLAQNNPEALAMVASQFAQAKGKVLADQFRMNQGEQQRAMETNRQTLNDAQMQNLGIRQTQEDKKQQAMSNTKMTNQKAFESIAAKTLQNKFENKQLAIAENMFNYRFDPQGRAYNVNPYAQFNRYGSVAAGGGKGKIQGLPDDWMSLYDETGAFQGTKKRKESDSDGKVKNGGIVKAIKNL